MRFPPVPRMRPKQRYDRRFWRTDDMLRALALYHGSTEEEYPRTWQYRTLVAAHREQHSTNRYRATYGKDWKQEIKPDVLEYARAGRLPLVALRFGAEAIRAVEQQVRASLRAVEVTERALLRRRLLVAAE